MRIDLIITELFVGGAERCLTELAIGLADAGDQVRVFSIGSLPEGNQAALLNRLTSAGITVDSAGADSLLQTPVAYRQLRRWLSASPPELCQTFMYHANVLGTWAARRSGVPLCVGGLRVAEPRSWRLMIERSAVGRMDQLVCVSSAVADFAERSLHCDSTRLSVIPNGVDTTRFASAQPADWTQLGWPVDAVVTLFVGRLHPQKGIDTLQRQVDYLAPPDSPRRLLLIGEGPLAADLDQWIDGLGGDRVKRLPWQSDIAPWIKAARLVVLPSRYEGMPNVILEAMAGGRPVVCRRVEGIPELLGESLHLQSFAVDDEAEMKSICEPFLSDAAVSDRVGSDNQSRVRREFSLAAMIDSYRSLYRELRAARRDE